MVDVSGATLSSVINESTACINNLEEIKSVMDTSLNEHSVGILNVIFADPYTSHVDNFSAIVS
jgi:hypothetical protein